MGANTSITGIGGGGKIKEEGSSANKEGGEDEEESRKNQNKKDAHNAKDNTLSSLNSPINPQNWEEILSIIGDPSRHILTKENYHIINSVLNAYEYAIIHNLLDFVKEASTNKCFHEKLLKFIAINKIGGALSQYKQIRLTAIVQAITQQASMYNTALTQLGAVVSSFANQYILRIGVDGVEITHIAIDIKTASIIGVLIGAITAIGIEIGNLKNDLRTQIDVDEYCVRGCSAECSENNAIKLLGDNEGNKLEEYSNKVMLWLERLVDIELDLLKSQLEKPNK